MSTTEKSKPVDVACPPAHGPSYVDIRQSIEKDRPVFIRSAKRIVIKTPKMKSLELEHRTIGCSVTNTKFGYMTGEDVSSQRRGIPTLRNKKLIPIRFHNNRFVDPDGAAVTNAKFLILSQNDSKNLAYVLP